MPWNYIEFREKLWNLLKSWNKIEKKQIIDQRHFIDFEKQM